MNRTVRTCSTPGRRSPELVTRLPVPSQHLGRRTPSAATYSIPGQSRQHSRPNPAGVGVLIPRPLSSHTRSNGTGSPRRRGVRRTIERADERRVVDRRVPKARDHDASSGHEATPTNGSFGRGNASPNARGRCEAIVDVCGITERAALPNTLWRPPEIGSRAPQQHRQHVGDRRRPRNCRARAA